MKNAHRWDILGFGIVTVDDFLIVESYPSPDAKTPVLEQTRQGGGLTGTALVAASRLGAKCAYGGVLGPYVPLNLLLTAYTPSLDERIW